MPRIATQFMIACAATGLGVGLCAAAARAQSFENLDRLDSIVAMTVGANVGSPGGATAPVDRRLKLASCPQVPEVSGPIFGAAMVECKPLGWRIRVPLNAGSAQQAQASTGYARPAAIRKEVVVKKGDPVQLVAGGTAFTVSRMMIADEDGAAGDMIRVREDKKSDPVLARVQEMGVVRAPDRFQ